MELRDTIAQSAGQQGWRMVLLNSLVVEKKDANGNWVSATGDFTFATTPSATSAATISTIIRYSKNTATTGAYRFTYKTQDSAMEHYYGSRNNKVKNTAQLFNGAGESF